MSPKEAFASQQKTAREMLTFIKQLYHARLKDGWTLGQIDEMDIHFYLEVIKEEADKQSENKEKVYIDQVW